MDINLGLDQDLINSVKNIVEACGCDQVKKEELVGGQKKLDKNGNGKLDADDFKKLRKEDTVEEGMEEFAKAQAKKLADNKKAKEKMSCEEVEELDELSKDTLKSYVKGASQDLPRLGNTLGRVQTGASKDNERLKNNISKTISNRYNGINKAVDKLTKEQVEEIEALAAKHGLGE